MTSLLMDSRVLFSAFVGLVALSRLVELGISVRNARALLARGGREAGRGHLPAMIALHVLFLVAAPAEVWLLDRVVWPLLSWSAMAVFAVAQAIRIWTVDSLGERWTVRVIAVPGDEPVTSGPYRFVRHPNYVVVALEILSIPLVHTAWITAVVFSAINAWILGVRIRAEEALLRDVTSYESAMAETPRFMPRGRAERRP